MADTPIEYRPYRPEDRGGINEILYRTGFMGEDLTGTGRFTDRVLFALVNTEGYLRFESENAFVAVDRKTGMVAGYIIGTADTEAYDRTFTRRMYWRIALRAFLVSLWRHPGSFRTLLFWARGYAADHVKPFHTDYPGHLHINILPGYQRLGIGGTLVRLFEERMAERGVRGVHLVTSNYNRKALPFYRKNGFEVLAETPLTFWPGVEGQVSTVFGKRAARMRG